MALLAGSPAIDASDNTNAPAYDQRGPGYPRIVNGTIDIGAFEVQSNSSTQASSLAVTGFPSVITAGNAGTFTVTALNSDGTTDTNYTFTSADAGVHTFTGLVLRKKGYQKISVTDTHNSSLTGSAIVNVL